MNDPLIPVSNTNIPVFASFLANSYARDLSVFTALSPEFNQAYLDELKADIAEIETLPSNDVLLKNLKVITQSIASSSESLRPLIDRLESYIILSKAQLPISLEDFNIRKLRSAISKNDTELILHEYEIMLQKIDINFDILQTKGFTAAHKNEINSIITSIKTNNELYNQKLTEKKSIIKSNNDKIFKLWNKLNLIMKAGKSIFRHTDKVKYDDYVQTEIKRRLGKGKKKEVEQQATETNTDSKTGENNSSESTQ